MVIIQHSENLMRSLFLLRSIGIENTRKEVKK